MSHRLIDRSPDLAALRKAGFHIVISNGYLLLKDVPYVTSSREVRKDGVLVSELDTEVVDGQEVTRKPEKHTVFWIGDYPCHADGRQIGSFYHPNQGQDLGGGLHVNFMFSAKANYRDYQHKLQAYLGWIVGEARKLDPDATAETHPIYAADPDDDDVFHYIDTASSRVRIGADNDKLRDQRVGIIGVGGTGSYVLDFVAKTRVAEIRIFDGDRFDTHNAFRAPGAWSLEELDAKKSKVRNFIDIYSKLRRRGLSGQSEKITDKNLYLLEGLTFVFLCVDQGKAKRAIVDWLLEQKIPFINVGMGITRAPSGLQGMVRLVTCTSSKHDHIARHIAFGEDDEAENEYATNIQIAELNALNAAMAVIRWKKVVGFYRDAGREHYSSFQIATASLLNEDVA